MFNDDPFENEVPNAGASKIKILVVDDSETVGKHIVGLLSRKGWSVFFAQNTPTALEEFRRRKPDVLLFDFVLEAGQTGIQLLSAVFALADSVRADLPAEKRRPPAAILTLGTLDPNDEAKAKAMGVRVLQKPRRGKEPEFLQEVEFWLREAGIQ